MKTVGALSLSVGLLCVGVDGARANVPVGDAAQLTQKSETKKHTNEMVPVQQEQNKGQKGINCATHTGEKGKARDTTSQPDTSSGANAVRQYDPQTPSTPSNEAKGPALAYQTLQSSAGKVVAGNMAAQTTISSTTPVYQQASSSAGRSATIMAGYDQNSSGAVQNGMTWNQVLATANVWIEAYNAMNLARVGGISQAAQAIRFIPWAATGGAPAGLACAAGYRGSGTAGDPCIAANGPVCQSLTDGGCWERRIVDALGNIVVYLESVSAQAQSSR